ncbi:MAG: diguanylate cyclase (GGDEF)-like protein [Oleispira sp.]|jgi:diguanylate cyclase (GGDEF)-like protein
MEKPALQQVIILQVKIVYCLLAAFALSIIALLDYLKQAPVFALIAASFSALLVIYASYLLLRRKKRTAPYLEWTLTILLGAFTIFGMQQESNVVQWVYFFPIYVFFLFPFTLANYITLTYSAIIFLMVLNNFDSYIRVQLLFTYTACYAFSMVYALVNDRNNMMLSNLINTDPLTQVYNEHQLHHNMSKEITRADRQRTDLALIIIRLPATWQQQKAGEYENRMAKVGHRLQSLIREFDTCYRLNNDDFVIMLPNSDHEDSEKMCEDLLAYISETRHAIYNDFLIKMATYRPEDDSYSFLKRATSQFKESN